MGLHGLSRQGGCHLCESSRDWVRRSNGRQRLWPSTKPNKATPRTQDRRWLRAALNAATHGFCWRGGGGSSGAQDGAPPVPRSPLRHVDGRIFKPVSRFHYGQGNSQVPSRERVEQNRSGLSRGLGRSSVFQVDSAENEGDTTHVVTKFWTSKRYFTTFFSLSRVSFYSLAINLVKQEFNMSVLTDC